MSKLTDLDDDEVTYADECVRLLRKNQRLAAEVAEKAARIRELKSDEGGECMDIECMYDYPHNAH